MSSTIPNALQDEDLRQPCIPGSKKELQSDTGVSTFLG
jgi:hypothetical protein